MASLNSVRLIIATAAKYAMLNKHVDVDSLDICFFING